MKKVALRLLDHIGLRRIARRANARARAVGLTYWTPQVPAESFYDGCRNAIRALRQDNDGSIRGDYLEFGVSRGTSLACMHRALQDEGLTQLRLFGFDSLEGLPADAANEGWEPGAFASTLSATRRYLSHAGVDWRRVRLIKGWFKNTLTPETKDRLGLDTASLIMMDCDLYSASRDALWFCEPLIRDRAVVFFDDWGSKTAERTGLGQREAFREFLAAFPDLSATPLPSYFVQARAFLVTRAPR